jgi:hypothetical protein
MAALGGSATGLAQRRAWWAFQPVMKPGVPRPAEAGVAEVHPIDAFIRAKLSAKGLSPAPQASHRDLIRRLHFDLTGLPPAPDALEASYEETAERLLASREYGERWGRHWLDIVRFGETDGGEHNYERPHAWRYRDYVIDSFQRDKPYNQFIREQLAGDLLDPARPAMVAATGFLVAGPWDQVQAEINKDKIMAMTQRMDELDDMVTTTANTFLGVTVNCARCHDHKFDPIPQRDYYRMTAVFAGVGFGNRRVGESADLEAYDRALIPLRKRLDDIQRQIAEKEEPARRQILEPKFRALDAARRSEPQRIPVNPYYNHNWFPAVTAKQFRFVMNGDPAKAQPKLTWLRAGATRLSGLEGRTFDIPGGTLTEIEWAATPGVYEFQASDDGTVWRTICSSLDHVGRVELDMPQASDAELDALVDRRALLAERAALGSEMAELPAPPLVYAARPRDSTGKSYLLERGSVAKPREEVTPGALSAIGHMKPDLSDAGSPDSTRRLRLADWITDPANPLTARVLVNRVWHYHFGAGIVNTPSDFGLMGDRPSHPELLDWLAAEFVEHGWSIKWLHRLIVSSETYKQSSAFNPAAHAVDAANRLLWRMPLRRMDAEMLRDSMLFVSGKLKMNDSGGPGFLLQKKGDRGSYIYRALDENRPEAWRRSVYRFTVRGGERVFLDSFDCPDPAVLTPQRSVSNTAVQALTQMNSSFTAKQSELLAVRADGVTGLYRLLFQREPSAAELALAGQFLRNESLAALARVLLNSNEFTYVP